MPERDSLEPGRDDHAQRLRHVSDSILAEIDEIRQLELEARRLRVGTPEFERVSAEITARTRAMFDLSGEQLELAEDVKEPGPAIEDVAPDDRR